MKSSGIAGFYKGIGALGLQACFFAMVFGGGHFLLSYFDWENKKVSDKE